MKWNQNQSHLIRCLPHDTDKGVFYIPTADFATEIIHVQGPYHGASKSIVNNVVHFVSDGSFVIESNPEGTFDHVRDLHLLIPNVNTTGFQMLAYLKWK